VRLAGVRPELKAGLVAATFEHHGEELGSGFAVLLAKIKSHLGYMTSTEPSQFISPLESC
jgi:hypothetical protein